jgi:hypothetical protein
VRIRWLLSFFLLAASLGWGQQQTLPPPPPFPNPRIGQPNQPPSSPGMSPEQMKKYNDERYAKLKHDTDELLQLATQLKQEVDKANSNTLSLDVIKKTEQIEKLAKSVRERMKAY